MSEALEKRKRIIDLKLIERDNIIYTDFEKNVEDNLNIDYFFCMQCHHRYSFKNGGYAQNYYLDKNSLEKLEILKSINISIYTYFFSLMSTTPSMHEPRKQGYSVKTSFSQYSLIQALGEKRFKELSFYGRSTVDGVLKPLFFDGFPVLDFQKHLEYGLICDEDISKIQNYVQNTNHGYCTTIRRNYVVLDGTPMEDRNLKTNNILIEVDLNKSKDEIINFIEKIKDDYDLDKQIKHDSYHTKNIPNIFDLLRLKEEDYFMDNTIISEDKNKKMFEKYADILFIYDCKQANFTYKEINQKFIDFYHHGIKSTTLKKYYNIAKELANSNTNEEFKEK